MKKRNRPFLLIFMLVFVFALFSACEGYTAEDTTLSQPVETVSAQAFSPETAVQTHAATPLEAPALTSSEAPATLLDEAGSYTTKEDVALYIHIYGQLPGNFITKSEANALGWNGGSLEDLAPGMCIGGDYFGNYEGLLPEADGRSYTECDIDTLGASSRGAKRIVFSNDGLIYYTDDHYESFTLLYE